MAKEWTLEEIEAIPEDPKAKKEYSLDEIDKIDDAILTKSGLKEAALKSIPVAAGLAGGAAGFLSPVPGGAFIGGTSGAAAGKMLENAIRRQEGEEIDPLQAYVAGPAQEAAGYAAGEAVVPAGSAILKGAGNAIGTAAKKVTSALSMVPEKVIETFASRTDDVAKLGNMSDPVVLQDAADTLREGAIEAIDDFKSVQNKKISNAIDEHGGQIIDLEPVYKILNEAYSKMHEIQSGSKALINEAYEDLS
jgi:hypothetical protein